MSGEGSVPSVMSFANAAFSSSVVKAVGGW